MRSDHRRGRAFGWLHRACVIGVTALLVGGCGNDGNEPNDAGGDSQPSAMDAGNASLDAPADAGTDALIDGQSDARDESRDVTVDALDASDVADMRDADVTDVSFDARDADIAVDSDGAGRDVIEEDPPRDSLPPPPDNAECTYHGQCPPARPYCDIGPWKCMAVTAVAVLPANASIPSGATRSFSAEAMLSNGSRAAFLSPLTWALGYGTGSGEIDGYGLAKGRSLGTVTITASFFGISGSTEATVTPGTLSSIEVAHLPQAQPATTLPLRVIGRYTDQTIQDVTLRVTWETTDPAVAILDPVTPAVTAGQVGVAGARAILGNLFDVAWLNVSTATLTSLEIYPPNGSYPTGGSKGFQVTGHFSDGTLVPMTDDVVWASSSPGVAFVNSSNAWSGLVQTIAPGVTTISATYGAVTGSVPLTVTGVGIQSMAMTPPNPTLQEVLTLAFQVTGTLTDNSTQDLNYAVTWSSSDPRAAIFDGTTSGSGGMAKGVAAGTSTITATLGSLSASTLLTVTR